VLCTETLSQKSKQENKQNKKTWSKLGNSQESSVIE
jgi:hypothetical protein